jgi:predicted O-methyltransferase YrrM
MQIEFYVLIAVLLIAFLATSLNLYLIRKLNWVRKLAENIKKNSSRQFRQLFRQMQLLQALQQDLDFPKSLPPAGGKAGSPDFLKTLADYVLAAKPDMVVECGSGVSTVVVARCLQLNGRGRMFSLEHMPQFAEQTRAQLKRQNLSEWASVLEAPLDKYSFSGQDYIWYRADEIPEGAIDLLIVDGPPARTGRTPRYPAGPMLFNRLSPRGVIFIDDAARPEELATIKRWQAEFANLSFDTNIDEFQKGISVAKHRSMDNC